MSSHQTSSFLFLNLVPGRKIGFGLVGSGKEITGNKGVGVEGVSLAM